MKPIPILLGYLLCLLSISFSSGVRIMPTLFTNNRIYALQNQHTGSYLTAGKDGIPYRTSDQGTHTIHQLWKVQAIDKNGFKLLPINGEPTFNILWKPVYVGFGNYQLQAVGTEQCLEATGKGDTGRCDRDNQQQEWFPTLKDDEAGASATRTSLQNIRP